MSTQPGRGGMGSLCNTLVLYTLRLVFCIDVVVCPCIKWNKC